MGDALVSEDFLDADANGDDVGSAHADAPLPAPEILAALDREVGEGIRRAFLTAHLQSTLQALKKTRGGPTPRALRAVSQVEAARIASDFLDGIVARVRSGVPPPERPTAG